MTDTVTTIITATISSITVLIAIWYKDYLNKRNAIKNTISREDKSMFYLEMDKTCNLIRESLKADGSYLAYFHNGGVFTNGITMDKFTVVGEDYNEIIHCQSYKKWYYATMINYISYGYHRLLTTGRYGAFNIEDVSDLSFKNDLIKRKIKSFYMFLIKDPVTDKPVGFFSLEYINSFDLPKFHESEIWKHQNKLSRLLSMTVLTD